MGEYINTHKPEEIRKVRILDPACGSGSFLIRAYKELENYWKQNSDFAQLTLDSEEFYSKRVEILRNNIFGVDLDPKAVEIAQLNLLLQISEKKQRLPLLQNNIKVGNSLIDDPSVSDRAFKWEEEFPEIIDKGGFDIVIGNPPYINIKFLTKNDSGEKNYYQQKFTSAVGNYDLYVLFIEKGISLLRANGLISLIIPNKFMVTDYGNGIRKYVLDTVMVEKILDVSSISVFKDIGIYPIIFIFKRENNENLRMLNEVKTYRIENENDLNNNNNFFKLEQKKYAENKNKIFLFGNYSTKNKIIQKVLKNAKFLSDISEINSGTTGFEYTNWGKYITESKTKDSVPFIITGNIEKYILNRNKPVRYQGKKLINAYFTKGDDVTEGKWALFTTTKIVIRGMALTLTASYDDLGCACGVSVYTITNIDQSVDMFYLLGALNSRLIDFYYKSQFSSKHLSGGYIGYNKGQIQQIPIVIANRTRQEEISRLVQDYISKSKILLSLNGKKNDERARLEEILNNYQKSIDTLIYQVYGIDKSEIETIENIEQKI